METADDDHYYAIVDKLAGGRLIPFLGAGANLCDRADEAWDKGLPFLPSGAELAAYLAKRGRYPVPDESNLLRVSQYVGADRGEDELYLYLHEVFNDDYQPTSLHRLLAKVAARLARARTTSDAQALIQSNPSSIREVLFDSDKHQAQFQLEDGTVFNVYYATDEEAQSRMQSLLAEHRVNVDSRGVDTSAVTHLLVVTTNYDDLVERAFSAVGLDYDVVWYEAKNHTVSGGCFVHCAPGKTPKKISKANTYRGLQPPLERPVVLKLHGCLDRKNPRDDSYVITEDNYIDYLSSGGIGMPIALWERMTTTSILFLGYSLSDWNLRVILNRMWATQQLASNSWAVQRAPADSRVSKIEQKLWDKRRNVELVYCELSEYVRELEARLEDSASVALESS